MSDGASGTPIRGSCLCGGVRFEVRGKPLWMSRCHCARCRKSCGGTTVSVRARDFRFVAGRELIVRYEPAPPYNLVRCFCRVCGTHLGEPETNPRGFPIAAHTFDDDPGVRLAVHTYVVEKPAWYEIEDALPQFPADPPGFGGSPAE